VASRALHKDDPSHTSSPDDGRRDGYEYDLRLVEDLDDGRYHEELEDWSKPKMNAVLAEKGYIEGRVRHIPVHKVFAKYSWIDA